MKNIHKIKENIYITNDEEIENCWFVNLTNNEIGYIKNNIGTQKNAKKIILTTDQGLIKDGVQAVDDEFLQWFVNNPSCEEVKVYKDERLEIEQDFDFYEIIILKEEQKKILIDMMKDDEELGLYDDIKANRIELVCKDCSDSLEDCTCIVSTIDFPRQEIKLEEVFNDEKKENIKKFIDEINNPSEPNDKLKQAFEKYSEYLEDYENKNTYEHGFKDGAKCQQEIMYSEEEIIAFGEFIFKHSLLTHTKGVRSLFEQFKKK